MTSAKVSAVPATPDIIWFAAIQKGMPDLGLQPGLVNILEPYAIVMASNHRPMTPKGKKIEPNSSEALRWARWDLAWLVVSTLGVDYFALEGHHHGPIFHIIKATQAREVPLEVLHERNLLMKPTALN